MTGQPFPNAALYDDPELYARSSDLRQQPDADWALSLMPDRRFRSCLDIGCGNGEFCRRLVNQGRVSQRVVGIDRSGAMVAAARQKLTPLAGTVELRIEQADALDLPHLGGGFDLVVMMAVLHWLYPDEQRVLSWIAGLLAGDGVFCLTTYHPSVDDRSRGGSDEIVLEAMKRADGPTDFPESFVPMGRRARQVVDLEPMLRECFQIQEVHRRSAVTRATDAGQYTQYHLATFGSYYAQLLPAELRPRFLEAIGEVALDRMKTLDYVTRMEVRLWVCLPRIDPRE